MNSLLSSLKAAGMAILDVALPPRARTARARTLSLNNLSLAPTSHELLRMQITTLMNYRDQDVRALVQSLKYDGYRRAARLCAFVLAEYLREEIADARKFSQKRIVLVPLPLHASRERERGFNQIEVVLRALPPEFRDGTLSTLDTDILLRTRATKPQTHFLRADRLSNVAGAFEAKGAEMLRNAHVYLIDDVTTTGATLVNAATPLRRAGARVSLIALARA